MWSSIKSGTYIIQIFCVESVNLTLILKHTCRMEKSKCPFFSHGITISGLVDRKQNVLCKYIYLERIFLAESILKNEISYAEKCVYSLNEIVYKMRWNRGRSDQFIDFCRNLIS